jgi:Actin
MFCDDILALIFDIGHSKSVAGFSGDEVPKYYAHSFCSTPTTSAMQEEES